MNINLKFLLLGTSLSLIPQYAAAQCAITDCLQLGYTSLKSCDGGLKCPFGEYWACPCDASYKYICTGANESKGSDSCGGKYSACQCASGYNWNNGKCEPEGVTLGQCSGNAKNCKIGDILNTDGSCSNDKVSGKTPIGIVIYISQQNCGWAITASPIATGIPWGGYGTDILSLPNHSTPYKASEDIDSCGNTQKIIQFSKNQANQDEKSAKELYPAAWEAADYAPDVAPTTKGKWCLPAAGILSRVYPNLSIVNNAISKHGGIKITNNEHILSSTENHESGIWIFQSGYETSSGLDSQGKNGTSSSYTIRPIIEF